MMWWKTSRTTCSVADRLEQVDPEEGPVLQVEGAAGQFGQWVPGVPREEPLLLPCLDVLRVDQPEDRRVIDGRERAPERLMAGDDPAEARRRASRSSSASIRPAPAI